MDITRKLELLADVMDLDVSEVKADSVLKDLGWDSVAALTFIVTLDEKFGRTVKEEDIKALVTVQDALNLMNGESEAHE